MSTPSPPLFRHFTSLPKEIRLVIWRLNLSSRNVLVYYNIQTGRFHSTTPLPANLQVCRESRLESSEWQLHFGTSGHAPQIRANFAIDHIQMDWDPIRLKVIPLSAIQNIRWLEIGGTDLQRMDTDSLLAHLLSFRNLEHLSLVSPPPEPLCAKYYSREILADRPEGSEDVFPGRLRAELLGHQERRHMAFEQHFSLATAMCKLKDVREIWGKPRLWLFITTESGEREGPYQWTLTGLPRYHGRLELLI